MSYKLYLTKYVVNSRQLPLIEGNIKGTCIFCESETNKGHRVKDTVSDNFTMWQTLRRGNCACEYCYTFFKEPTHRRKSWIVENNTFRILEKEEKKTILFEKHVPPFFIYISKIGQKHPWVELLQYVAYSDNHFWFAHEDLGKIYFERKKAEYFRELIQKAINLKITKTELKGEFKMKTYERAWSEGFEDFLTEVKKHKKQNLWEVIVDVF